MARPSKLTPEIRDKVCRAIADGQTRYVAARLTGINKATLCRWLARGKRQKDGPFRDLYDAVKTAEAKAEEEAVLAIRVAGQGDWRAMLEWLKAMRPQTWSVSRRDIKETMKDVADMKARIAAVERQRSTDAPDGTRPPADTRP